jgi:hypothetical protein
LGIGVKTMPEPPRGLRNGFLSREDVIEAYLMASKGDKVPVAWNQIDRAAVCDYGFKSLSDSGGRLDAARFFVHTTFGEEKWSRHTANFFPGYQQLDEQASPEGAPPLTLDERHRAAAYAAAFKAVRIDAMVTNMPTAGTVGRCRQRPRRKCQP